MVTGYVCGGEGVRMGGGGGWEGVRYYLSNVWDNACSVNFMQFSNIALLVQICEQAVIEFHRALVYLRKQIIWI